MEVSDLLIILLLFLTCIGLIYYMRKKNNSSYVVVTQPTPQTQTFQTMEEIKEEYPPSVYDSINKLVDAYAQGEESAVIELARIYMFGLHPHFLPDKLSAGQICNFIIYGDQFSKVAKVKAKELIKELKYDDIHDNRQYYPLPANPVDILSKIVPEQMIYMKAMDIGEPTPQQPTPTQDHPFIRTHHDVIIDIDDIDVDTQAALLAQFAPPLPRVGNDSQNVHSSTVQTVANARLKTLEKENKSTNNSFLTWLSTSDLKPEQKENIREVLASLNSTSSHSRYGKSEKDVFETVWARVNAPVNRDRFDDMAKVFAESIASSIEHGVIVCSTGKIVRMIGSLDAIDAEPEKLGGSLKPEWALDTEMAGIASVIRENVLKNASEQQRNAYQEGTDDTLETEMKNVLKDRLKTDYVDTSLLSQDAVDLKFDVLSAGF